eukprot:CAMPEP_0196809870 /NCGR_PEP_ID=MMETSP1362-20130617/9746_1 /TAXON_ID=163516 /ORGANISM="Leptocylindrus danicus, Strain CCMP1856" /LENGTH=170 /DNA_ID=CAMNT_0042184689 /DNA_START=60 /DNA_END=569 /DNA_ORIENTATION=+
MTSVYPLTAAYFHWIVAVPLIGSVGSVLKCQSLPKGDKDKGLWMHRHKSLGLLTGMLVLPRFGYRLLNFKKHLLPPLEGSGQIEHGMGNLSHLALYGFMTVMPASGIAMGYYGGKGLPFFNTSFPGVVHTDETKAGNVAIAKQSYSIHKTLGTYGKYLIPLHAGAAVAHW